MKLNVSAFALATGIVLAISFFVATLIVGLQGGGAHLYLLHRFCPGYAVSIGGSFLGLIYGFVYGFVVAGLLAFLYNSMSSEKASN